MEIDIPPPPPPPPPEVKKKAAKPRKFKETWLVDYFVIQNGNVALCLICKKTISVLREFNISRHYRTLHEREYQQFTDKTREEKAHMMKHELMSQEPLYESGSANSEAVSKISTRIVELIAKNNIPLTDGDFIKECLDVFAGSVCPSAQTLVQSIFLSPKFISVKIKELSDGIKESLLELTPGSPAFSLALVGTTDPSFSSQLFLYARGFSLNGQVFEELLDMYTISDMTTGTEISSIIKNTLERFALPLSGLCGIFTDGAPILSSKCNEFVSLLLPELPNDIFVHDNIRYQEQLVLCFMPLDHVLKKVFGSINYIASKPIPPYSLQFFLKIDSDLSDVNFNGIRWQTLFSSLLYFWNSMADIKKFLLENNQDSSFLTNVQWVNDFAFLLDISKLLSELCQQLQEKTLLIHHMQCHFFAFTKKLELIHSQMLVGQLANFPLLSKRHSSVTKFKEYAEILAHLITIFKTRSAISNDFIEDVNAFSDPFSVDVSKAHHKFQMELIDLQNNPEFKRSFKENDIFNFYKKSISKEKFPALHDNAFKVMSLFGNTSYFEMLLSNLKQIKQNAKHGSKDLVLDLLRIATSQIQANLISLAHNRPF